MRYGYERKCSECGTTAKMQGRGEFCSTPCRKKFNNRRMLCGAELYDQTLVVRSPLPKKTNKEDREHHARVVAHAGATIDRLFERWQAEDERAGRKQIAQAGTRRW